MTKPWRSATLAALLVVLCACGSPAPPAADPTLRVALNYAPTTVDPHTVSSPAAAITYLGPLYDRLTQIGPDLQVQPMLATAWTFAPDGRSADFTLRADATFASGAPVDAAAVAASLDRALTVPGSTARAGLSMIEGVEVVDPATVRVRTTRPAADLPYALAGVEWSVIDPAARERPDLDRVPAGSGPYTLGSLVADDRIVLHRREGYWDPAAQQVAHLEIVGVANDSTRMNGLRSDEFDLMMTTAGQFDEVDALGSGFTTHSYPPASTYTVFLNTARPHLSDPRVRQALNFAVDRASIDAFLLDGRCAPASQPLVAVYPGHLEPPPVAYGHDPARARALLAEAGVPEGTELRLLVPAGLSLYERIGAAVQAQFAEVGIRAVLEQQASAQIFASWTGGGYDGFVNVRTTRPTDAMTLQASYLNPNRYPGPTPAGFAESVVRAFDPGLDEAARLGAVREASTVGAVGALDVFLCSTPAMWTAHDRVRGADTMGASYYTAFGDLRGVGLSGDE
ncbi:ABC transporter substrate-binding protein [Pseudonocardia pini]|uniref:ABC transporter substrate-binding protein n=1 Tax=Pseudonocardia pini TaxID=2758030 RepID=UPI0015F10D67|nr:ABC transporter substrate-binding protein [Pseudonocardia pini]